MTSRRLITAYGEIIHVSKYESDGHEGVVIIGSALGVPQRFYKHIAAHLATEGFEVVTFDYLGIGESMEVSCADECNLLNWGARDLYTVIEFCRQEYPKKEIHFLGHSISGQLLPFASNAPEIKSACLVASQNVSRTNWTGKDRLILELFWNAILPISNSLFNGMPGWAYGGNFKIPKKVAHQWSQWAKTKHGAIRAVQGGAKFYQRMHMPVMLFSIEKDNLLAPIKSVKTLVSNYGSNAVHRHINEPLGHFGFFRKQNYLHWQGIINFFKSNNEADGLDNYKARFNLKQLLA